VSALAKSKNTHSHVAESWIHTLASWFAATDRQVEIGLRTHFSTTFAINKPALFLPAGMASHQPENLAYLHRFAARNNCRLIEDRRTIDVKPLIEQRNKHVAPLMLASIQLLQQAGMHKKAPRPSAPNRLHEDSIHIPVAQLVQMALRVVDSGKRIVVLPNPTIVKLLGGDTSPIVGYAANMMIDEEKITVAYFESPKYRSIGYRCGDQFINHILLAGGPMRAPTLWAAPETLIESNARFQLYRSERDDFNLGLMSVTQYIQL